MLSYSQSITLEATCQKCGKPRDLPEADRARWPAVHRDDVVTVGADTRCPCGSRRVKLRVKLA